MKYSEIMPVDQVIEQSLASTDPEDYFGPRAVPEPPPYKISKENGEANNSRLRRKRRNTARQLVIQIRSITNWSDRRRHEALNKLHSLRPSKKRVIEYYLARGDSLNVAKMLVRNYETLPVVHLTRRDFFVLRDLINGRAQPHSAYIERLLNASS